MRRQKWLQRQRADTDARSFRLCALRPSLVLLKFIAQRWDDWLNVEKTLTKLHGIKVPVWKCGKFSPSVWPANSERCSCRHQEDTGCSVIVMGKTDTQTDRTSSELWSDRNERYCSDWPDLYRQCLPITSVASPDNKLYILPYCSTPLQQRCAYGDSSIYLLT